MMRDYGKVSTAIHTDPKSASWSDNAFRIAIYLLAGPHTNMIGCFRLPIGYVAEDLGKGYETVSEGFRELSRSDFIAYDERCRWVWIKRFLEHNPFENANVAKSARRLAQQVPEECSFHAEFCRTIKDVGKWEWDKAGDLSEGLPNPSETVSEPFATPEPEPEPEPEEYGCSDEHPSPRGELCVVESQPDRDPPKHVAERMVAIWHQECGEVLPHVQKLTDKRVRMANARFHDELNADYEAWRSICQRVRASPFLRGETGRDSWPGADFEWCIRPSNLPNILEGKYDPKPDNKRNNGAGKSGGSPMDAGLANLQDVEGW